jgi:hypothetical protein
VAISVGANGQVLVADSTCASGLKWAASSSGTVSNVATGTGLTGGPITSTGTIALANTAVTPGSYTYAAFAVDAQGRLTAAANGCTPLLVCNFDVKGDLLAGTGNDSFARIPVGTAGQVLSVNASCATGLQWVTPVSGTVTSVIAGTGLSGGTITSTGTIALSNTTVASGSYTYSAITVDPQGRITAASNGCTPVLSCCINAKGDLLVGTADNAYTRQVVGTNGQALLACSTCASGVVWDTVPGTQFATPTVPGINYGAYCNTSLAVGGCAGTAIAATGPITSVFLGGCAGRLATAASSNNVAVGWKALQGAIQGDNNIAIGKEAGAYVAVANTTCQNVLIGSYAAQALNGNNTIAIGFCAAANPVGNSTSNSVFIGTRAGLNSEADNSVMIGSEAGAYNDQGGNTFLGYLSGQCSQGSNNVFLGNQAAVRACATDAIAIGLESIYGAGVKDGTVALGRKAFYNLGNGCENVAIGRNAGSGFRAGDRTIQIGYCSGTRYAVCGQDFIVIGSNSSLGRDGDSTVCGITIGPNLQPQSGCVWLGYGGMQSAWFNLSLGGWSFTSDRSTKKNITALGVNGENFINSLRPSTYTHCFADGECAVGFIAQDVQKSLEDHGVEYINNLVTGGESEETKLGLTTTSLVPFLVKAVQELSAKVASLEAKLAE